MQSNIFCKTMIPICPLRDEILLFLSYGLRVLYEGFRHLLVAGSTLQPGVGALRSVLVSLRDKAGSIWYANPLGASCTLQGWENSDGGAPAAPPSLATSTPSQYGNSWFSFRPLTFEFCSQGEILFWRVLISNCRHNKSHSILMAGKRVQGQTVPQPHQRYLVNRVGSKSLRKCTIKETNVNFFSATVFTAPGFRSLRVC